jgi:hypothetical protein
VPEIKFDQNGFAYVRIYIRASDSPSMALLPYKVDSGANRTTISSEFLNDLGYDNDWIMKGELLKGDDRPTVATGEQIDDCYIVALPEINVGDYVGYNWPFLTSLSVRFRNLLDTDSMRFFNWEFNYETEVCRYNLIPGKRKMLFNQREQSMHSLDNLAHSP